MATTTVMFSVFDAAAASNDARARQQHLPFIRAYTECIAQAVRENRSSVLLAKRGEWKAAVKPVMTQCDQQGATMVLMHDRLYGPGTGIPFLRGPYLSDLPRALGVRLQPTFEQIDRQEAEAQRVQEAQEAQAREVQAEREKLVDASAKEYLDCLQTQVMEILPYSNESATVITDVVFQKCSPVEDKIRTVLVATTGQSKKSVDEAFMAIKADAQRSLTANIVATRAKVEREKREKPEVAPSSPPAVHRL